MAGFTWQTGKANNEVNGERLFQGMWKWKVIVPLPHLSDSITGAHMVEYVGVRDL